MDNMIMRGQAGTSGALCPVSVRPILLDRRERRGTGDPYAVFGAFRTFSATDVAFLPVRAVD